MSARLSPGSAGILPSLGVPLFRVLCALCGKNSLPFLHSPLPPWPSVTSVVNFSLGFLFHYSRITTHAFAPWSLLLLQSPHASRNRNQTPYLQSQILPP